jgi:hypothetical protein
MRPPEHDPESYARDLAALSRMLRRVVSDTKITTKDRKEIEKHIRSAIGLLSVLKRSTPKAAKAPQKKKRKFSKPMQRVASKKRKTA